MKLSKEKAICEISRGIFLTFHAVEQYISRWKKGIEFRAATSEIASLLFDSHVLPERTPKGDRILVSDIRPDIRFVLSKDNFIVTTLPQAHRSTFDITEFQEIYAEEVRVKANSLKIQLEDFMVDVSKLEAEFLEKSEEFAKAKAFAAAAAQVKGDANNKLTAAKIKIESLQKDILSLETEISEGERS